jgi:hypothetical protein
MIINPTQIFAQKNDSIPIFSTARHSLFSDNNMHAFSFAKKQKIGVQFTAKQLFGVEQLNKYSILYWNRKNKRGYKVGLEYVELNINKSVLAESKLDFSLTKDLFFGGGLIVDYTSNSFTSELFVDYSISMAYRLNSLWLFQSNFYSGNSIYKDSSVGELAIIFKPYDLLNIQVNWQIKDDNHLLLVLMNYRYQSFFIESYFSMFKQDWGLGLGYSFSRLSVQFQLGRHTVLGNSPKFLLVMAL